MKRRELVLVLLLIGFGLLYHSVRKADWRGFRDLSIRFGDTDLASDKSFSFPEAAREFSAVSALELRNPAGSVQIDKAHGDQLRLTSTIQVYHERREEAEKMRQQIQVVARVVDGELRVAVVTPEEFPYRRVRIQLQVEVPAAVKVNIYNQLGDVVVRDTGRDVFIEEKYGNITATGVPSSLYVNSKYGEVQIEGITGLLEADCSYGTIKLSRAGEAKISGNYLNCVLSEIAGDVDLKTSYGRIDLENARSVRADSKQTIMVVRQVKQGVSIKNSYKALTLENITGPISLSTRYCLISLRSCSADSLLIEDSYESVITENLRAHDVSLRLYQGKADLHFLQVSESLNIDASYANVQLQFPATLNPSWNLSLRYGELVNETNISFPILREKTEQLVNLSAGKPEITIQSLYGNITLRTFSATAATPI